jgi:hypothetical protein
MNGIILSADVHHPDIPDVFTKNVNNPASVRILCANCHLFLGVLGQFHALNDRAHPNVNGHRLVICEELSVLSVEQTVNWLRRVKRNPNLAERKGCQNIMIFNSDGKLVKSVKKGVEGWNTLKAAHDMLKKKKEQAGVLAAWRANAEAAMDRFTTVQNKKIWSR